MVRFIFAGYLFLNLLPGYSQQPGIYPLPFVKFTDNYTFDNPAAASLTKAWEINLVNSFYTGLVSNIGFYYLDASVHTSSKNNSNHTPGLMIYSEYETEIFKRTRVYGRYAWSTSLTSTLKLSAGIHAGFFNYSVKSTNSSAGASATVPDATVGLWLAGKKYNVGISSAQITGAEITPINRRFLLNRYFVFTGDYAFQISQTSGVLLAVKAWKGQRDNAGLHPAVKLILAKNFSAEFNYLFRKGAGFSLGLLEVSMLKIHSNLSFSYFQPLGSLNPFNAQRLEIFLKLYK